MWQVHRTQCSLQNLKLKLNVLCKRLSRSASTHVHRTLLRYRNLPWSLNRCTCVWWNSPYDCVAVDGFVQFWATSRCEFWRFLHFDEFHFCSRRAISYFLKNVAMWKKIELNEKKTKQIILSVLKWMFIFIYKFPFKIPLLGIISYHSNKNIAI